MAPANAKTPAAFKASLDARIREQSKETGRVQDRLRTLLVMERFLARILEIAPGALTLKGGLALELRLQRARTTMDVDLRATSDPARFSQVLDEAISLRLQPEDHLEFSYAADPAHPEITADWMSYDGLRFRVMALLAGKPYGNPFGLDIAAADRMVSPPDQLLGTTLLERYGFERLSIPTYPVSTHLAEKLHAYTIPRDRENSRLKDLVDMALLSEVADLDAATLREAVTQTFTFRGTHPIPTTLPDPPEAWRVRFAKMQREERLPWRSLDELLGVARALLEPALNGASGRWRPDQARFEPSA